MRVIASLLLLCSLAAADEQALSYYQQGNSRYEAGDYAQAIAAYEKALATGYESAELYFNLGNAYYKSEQLGKSILHYERAARLLPNDADIGYNLELARLRIVDKIVVPPEMFLTKIWRSIKTIFTVNQWAVMALALYVLTISMIILCMLRQTPTFRYVGGWILIPLFILALIASSFFLIRLSEEASHRQAVIMAAKVSVLSAPAADATEVFALHEGTKVRLGESSGAYLKIDLPDGKVGWVRQDALEKI